MNWITRQLKKILPKKKKSLDVAVNSWQTCKRCKSANYIDDLRKNFYLCSCGSPFSCPPRERFKYLFDNSKWEEVPYDTSFKDFLNWKDRISYKERVQKSIEATGQDEVGVIAKGEINGTKVCCLAMNFLWAGGSVGHNFGECVIKAAETCREENLPLVIFTESGGARMMEGAISLMQLPRMTVAIQIFKDMKQRQASILFQCSPTSGGLSASLANICDFTLAEHDTDLIAFSGRRVIEGTLGNQETIPDDFQTAISLKNNGFLDDIIERPKQKEKISTLISLLQKKVA